MKRWAEKKSHSLGSSLTVNPFFNVVVCVVTPGGSVGAAVARALVKARGDRVVMAGYDLRNSDEVSFERAMRAAAIDLNVL